MNVAVIGHTGMGGITLVDLLLARGHQVTGIAIDADKHPTKKGLAPVTCSVMDTDALAKAIDGHDVVVSAFSGGHRVEMGVYYRQVEGTRRMIKAFKEVKGNTSSISAAQPAFM